MRLDGRSRSSPAVPVASAPRRPSAGGRRGGRRRPRSRTPTGAAALADELGDRVAAVAGDSNDDDAVIAAIERGTVARCASRVAVSATGVVIPSQRLVGRDGSMLAKEALLANLELHVCGPFNLARLAAAAFADNEPDPDGQRGVIVQTASISAFDGQVTMVPYAAAKGAVVSMTLPMARDLAPIGIRVCAIAPGAFATPRLSSPHGPGAARPRRRLPEARRTPR